VRGFESKYITIGTPKHQVRNLLRAQTMAYAFFSMAAHDNCDPVNLELAKEIGLSVPSSFHCIRHAAIAYLEAFTCTSMVPRNGWYISYAAYIRIELVLTDGVHLLPPQSTPPLPVCPWRPSLIKHGSNQPHLGCRLKNTKRNRALSSHRVL